MYSWIEYQTSSEQLDFPSVARRTGALHPEVVVRLVQNPFPQKMWSPLSLDLSPTCMLWWGGSWCRAWFSSVLECVLHWPCSVLLETQNCFQDLLENLTPMIVDTVGSLEQLLPKNFLAQKNPSTFLLWTEGLLFDNSKLRFFASWGHRL